MHPQFFLQDTVTVAKQLIGKVLVSTKEGLQTSGRIVETEAYLGEDDAASHAFRGQTRRNSVMFGQPGHFYVYFTYGMHYCVNVVTAPKGVAEAVLIRALQPLGGTDVMEGRRRTTVLTSLCNGPAKLTQALGISGADNGAAVDPASNLWISDDGVTLPTSSGPRIGITRAVDEPLRFWATGSPYVSRPNKLQIQ